MDMDQIFADRHSNRSNEGLECMATLTDEIFTHNRSALELVNENVLGVDIAQVRAQRYAISRIEKSVSYMLQNLDQPIQMLTLGSLAGVSTSYFYSLFKSATGCTPNHFLIRARMRCGCELLRGTDMRVKEVAGMLGYVDPFYFSRLFKSVNGVAPSEYRGIYAAADDPTRRRLSSKRSNRSKPT
jgi:AraC-like DNA-binding protein